MLVCLHDVYSCCFLSERYLVVVSRHYGNRVYNAGSRDDGPSDYLLAPDTQFTIIIYTCSSHHVVLCLVIAYMYHCFGIFHHGKDRGEGQDCRKVDTAQ